MHRLLALAFLLLAACGQPPATHEAPVANSPAPGDGSVMTSEKAPRIVMLGDSLTAGYELSDSEALPAVVERQLAARGIKAKLINAGVSGDTTADGLNRWDWSVKDAKPDLLVVALGANDFMMKIAPWRPRKNLAAILERAKAETIPAVLIGVAIPGSFSDPSFPDPYFPDPYDLAYAKIYPELAQEYGLPYMPNFMAPVAGRSDLLMEDGLHPTARGVEAMAAGVADFLAPVIVELD